MDKVFSLHDAVDRFIKDGDSICLGGFTINRKPYAAVYEILRQKKGNFTVWAAPSGGDLDMLIGAGRLLALINCYTANSGFTSVSRRFRAACEEGTLLVEDYSQDVMMLLLHAGSLGLPFIAVPHMFGSDILDKWGISKEIREGILGLHKDKLKIIDNPFNTGQKLAAIPTPKLDCAVIHVQKASPFGTCRIEGSEFHDVDIAVLASRVIVTCEELVDEEYLGQEPDRNSIFGGCVDAVVHCPYGAHPSQCYNYYDYDKQMLLEYDEASKTNDGFLSFLQKWVVSPGSHAGYLDALGAERLHNLKAAAHLGFQPESKTGGGSCE